MASSLAVKRFLSSNNLLSNPLLRPVASTSFRSFNTKVDMPELNLDGNITSLNSKGYSFAEFDRHFKESLRRTQVKNTVDKSDKLMENSLQIQNMVDKLDKLTDNSLQIQNMVDKLDKLMNNSLLSATRGIGAGLNAKETEDALHLRVDMPGLSKEDVKISVEQNTLTIKGESAKESEEEAVRRFTNSINLPEKKLYKFDQIKAEMKNGVLKVIVPKMKEEERKDVIINVKVE